MSYPFLTPGRVISCWSERPYRIYMASERVFTPEWKSRPGQLLGWTRTGMTCFGTRLIFLCWYHVNEHRATRGNWSELVLEWKSRRYHVNTPLNSQKKSWASSWDRRLLVPYLSWMPSNSQHSYSINPWSYFVSYVMKASTFAQSCQRVVPKNRGESG